MAVLTCPACKGRHIRSALKDYGWRIWYYCVECQHEWFTDHKEQQK